jgi:hypothetical protein
VNCLDGLGVRLGLLVFGECSVDAGTAGALALALAGGDEQPLRAAVASPSTVDSRRFSRSVSAIAAKNANNSSAPSSLQRAPVMSRRSAIRRR